MKIKYGHKLTFLNSCTPVGPVFKRLSCIHADVYTYPSIMPIVADNKFC